MSKNILLYTNSDENGYTNKSFCYLLGFQPSLGYIVITDESINIVLDSRYYNNLESIDKDKLLGRLNKNIEIKFHLLDKKIEEIIKSIITDRDIKVEDSVNLKLYNQLHNFGFDIKVIKPYFDKQRMIKSEDEIENIKKAIKIIAKVWRQIEKLNKQGELIGKTEIQLRQFIINKIFEFGGSGESFEAIVATGANSAIPHHESGETKIKKGPLLVDMGAVYNGYCSDFTRTLWVGEKNEKYKEFNKIQKIVKKAHDEATKNIQIGIKTSMIDMIARNHITKAGFGEYFTHSTGHGVGLDIHEAPNISQRVMLSLEILMAPIMHIKTGHTPRTCQIATRKCWSLPGWEPCAIWT